MSRKKSVDSFHKPVLIAVEGDDDAVFFDLLLGHLGIQDVDVYPMNGERGWTATLRAWKYLSGFSQVTSIGLVRDCDDRPARQVLQSLRDSLKQAGLPVPKGVMKRSAPQDGLNTSIFLFEPIGEFPGMLETTCLQAFENDPAYGCIDPYFECLDVLDLKPRSMTKLQKARLEVFLASKITDPRLSIAVQHNWWPWDHPAFDAVKDFVRLVAGLS